MRRWTATYRFRFAPVISFERRRNALLDWVESNVDPFAFRDSEDEVGIELARGARIRIDRGSATLEDYAARKDGVDSLAPMLQGLFETMEPTSVGLQFAAIAWSAGFPDLEYSDATRRLAATVSGIHEPLGSGALATDTAALLDFAAETHHVQAEYGFVTPPELGERLEESDLGKIRVRPDGAVPEKALRELPDVSLFVDTVVTRRGRRILRDVGEMQDAVAAFETYGREVAEAIYASVMERESVR